LADKNYDVCLVHEESDVPQILFVFILSHGGEDGIIETDTMGQDQCNETFANEDVLEALKINKKLTNSLKVVMFGVSLLKSRAKNKINSK
jgi:hypothetical protein